MEKDPIKEKKIKDEIKGKQTLISNNNKKIEDLNKLNQSLNEDIALVKQLKTELSTLIEEYQEEGESLNNTYKIGDGKLCMGTYAENADKELQGKMVNSISSFRSYLNSSVMEGGGGISQIISKLEEKVENNQTSINVSQLINSDLQDEITVANKQLLLV